MVKQKQVYELECECGMKVKGFSEHHAKENLRIHRDTSKKHKELIQLKRKWERELKSKS
jgi:hypothetical protein